MTASEIFNISQNSSLIAVMDVHGAACDDAAQIIGSRFVRGNFDEEFIGLWFGSVQTILACGDDVSPDAYKFFASHNFKY